MNWTKVESTNIKRVGYDKNRKRMRVEFHHGGTYEYYPITQDVHDQIINAESVATTFNKLVKFNSQISWEKIR